MSFVGNGSDGMRQFDVLITLFNNLPDRILAEGMFQLKSLVDEGYNISQNLVHVITGQLKGSGVVQVLGNTIEFRYDKEYAGWEEFGNRYRPGHPYFTPGVNFITQNIMFAMGTAIARAVSMNQTFVSTSGAPFG